MDVQEASCTFVYLKINKLGANFEIPLKFGQSVPPVYVKLENEALRKLGPFFDKIWLFT